MKTTRILGLVALGIFTVVCGVAFSRARLLAQASKPAVKPVSQRAPQSPRTAESPVELGPASPFDPFAAAQLQPKRSASLKIELGDAVPAVSPLQQQFIDLIKEKAKRMSEDELKAAATELQGSLSAQDREAELALKDAASKLVEVSNKYRGTVSADKASKAIAILGFKLDEIPSLLQGRALDDNGEDSSSAPKNQ